MRSLVLVPLCLLPLSLLAACAEQVEVPLPDDPATSAAAAPEPAAAQSPPQQGLLLFDGQSLVLSGQPHNRVKLGAARAAAEQLAAAALGAVIDRSSNAECGAGAMQFTKFGSATFNFQDDKLVGWTVERGANIAARDGVQPGVTTLGALRRVQKADLEFVPDSTLGTEFRYPIMTGQTLGGFAESMADDALVTMLFAGTTCFFR